MGLPRVGILGGGQLAKFIALSLIERGVKVATLHGEPCSFLQTYTLEELIEISDILLLEQELSAKILKKIPQEKLSTPKSSIQLSSNKAMMKDFLKKIEAPCVPDGDEIYKSVVGGYDGRGVFDTLPEGIAYISEKKIQFDREISIMVLRSRSGQIALLPPTQTIQANGTCRWCYAPVQVSDEFSEVAKKIAIELNLVGIMAVEFFDVGAPIVNEFAIRPHNSYHWTLSTRYSQFDHYVDIALNRRIRKISYSENTVMKNILGGDKVKFDIDFVDYYMYGKNYRQGRKLGHVNISGKSIEESRKILNQTIIEC